MLYVCADGSIAHTGENLLSLIRGLSLNSEEPGPNSDNFVFFDILGLWFVAYRGFAVVFVHSAVCVCGLAMIYSLTKATAPQTKSALSFWLSLIKGEVYCVSMSVCTCAVVALLAWLLCPMRFYDGGLLVAYVIYFPPAITCAYFCRGIIANHSHTTFDIRVLSSLLVWTPLLALCILCGVKSGFLCVIWVGGTICAYVARHAASKWRVTKDEWVTVIGMYSYDLSLMLAVCIWWNVIHTVLLIVMPLLGRVGTAVPGDFVVGLIVAILLSLPCGVILADTNCQPPTATCVRRCVLAELCLLLVLAVTTSSYSSQHPKRLWMHHVHRDQIFEDGTTKVDHGILVTAMDGRGMYPFLPSLTSGEVANVPTVMNENNRMVNYCNSWNGDCYFQFPWLYPVADAMRDSFYIPTQKPPDFPEKSKLFMAMSSTTTADPLIRHIAISLRGPPRMNLIVRDNASGQRIEGWDIDISRKMPDAHFVKPSPARPEGIHYIQVEFGLCLHDVCEGEIFLKVQGSASVQVAAYGYYMSLADDATHSLLTALPDWATGAEWSSCPSSFISKFI